MSKAEILDELARLNAEERREILERICDLDYSALTAPEKMFLDGRLAECSSDKAVWSTWKGAKAK
jgi:hypothetical protein